MSVDAINSIRSLAGIGNLKNHQSVDRSKPLTLCANFSWTAFGSIFYNCCQFSLFVILAKIGSTEMAGQYTIGLAITAPVMIFFGSNLRAIIVSDVHREYQIGGYLTFRLISLAAALSMILAIILMSGYRHETALIIIMVGLAKSIEGISAIFFGYFQQNERMDQIAISRIAKGILSILFFVAGVWIFGTALGGVVGLAVAWLTTLLFFDIPRAHVLANHRVFHQDAPMELFWPVWNPRQLRKLFILSLPIGITVMLVSLSANIPRYFVEVWEGESALGVFGPISYFMVLGNEIVLALGQSAAPRMAKYYVHKDRMSIIRLLLREKAVGAVLGIIGVVLAAAAGPWLLSFAFGPEYIKYGNVFLLLAMTSGITLVFGFSGMFLTAARAFWIQIPVRVCSLAAMAVCCMVLVPSHGIDGAAIAMFVSALVHSTLAFTAVVFMLYRMQNTGEITLQNNGQCDITPCKGSELPHPKKAAEEEEILELGA
ncbi:MAG: oligosaccharide flippase family protein [Pirellulales bacterium]|nr:oligosaccharide flippase family protein [Pirellulales bacterium]